MAINLLEKTNMAQNVQNNKNLEFQNRANLLKGTKDKEELKTVCQDFEAILLDYMLKSMRNTVTKSKLLDGGLKQEIFESMYDQEISNYIAHSDKSMGLGDMLYKQLSRDGDKNEK